MALGDLFRNPGMQRLAQDMLMRMDAETAHRTRPKVAPQPPVAAAQRPLPGHIGHHRAASRAFAAFPLYPGCRPWPYPREPQPNAPRRAPSATHP